MLLPSTSPTGLLPLSSTSSARVTVCTGHELAQVLAEKAVNTSQSAHFGSPDPLARRRQFDDARTAVSPVAADGVDLSSTAVCILLDQSGSMAKRMPRIAGEFLVALEELEARGAATMLAGFTTVGWHGGHSRQQWLIKGRPHYPGRLCDLLHIVYSDFSQATSSDQLEPLLSAAIFFENIDGEAIEWGEALLRETSQVKRCLIVVSDGAPVDDSSLLENVPTMLWDHLEKVISGCRDRGAVALGAVGIDHRVDGLYPASRMTQTDGNVAQDLVDLVIQLAAPEPSVPGNATNPS